MTDLRPADAPSPAPVPRRTRAGAVIVGPSLRARYVPAALIDLPMVAVLLSTFAAAGIQQWQTSRLLGGHDGPLEQLLAPAWVQLLLGAFALGVLFSLWALVPMILTHSVVRRPSKLASSQPLSGTTHCRPESSSPRAVRAGSSRPITAIPPRSASPVA